MKPSSSFYEFLPAALEIQERPPHPLSRALAWTLIGLFSLGILWACLGKVNVVASAEGKIIPSTRSKIIQPANTGVIKAIYVSEGRVVKAGDALLELEQTLTQADTQRLQNALDTALAEKQRLVHFTALLTGQPQPEDGLNPHQAQLLEQQWQHHQAQQAGLAKEQQAKQAELDMAQAQIARLAQTLPIVRNRASKLQQLVQKNLAAEDDYLHAEQIHIETAQNLKAEQARQRQLRANLGALTEQIHALSAQTLAAQFQQLTQTQERIDELREELTKAQEIHARQTLYAPVDGVVQDIKVNTLGGVVTAAQELMTLVPADEQLIVQAVLTNKDIGYVFKDMPAEIKIHTFPFTEYGVIEAQVTHISDDALLDTEQGLIFSVYLSLHKNSLKVQGRDVRLMPGMSVTAEMRIKERRIIEYLLNPIQKGFAESLRER